MVEMDKTISFMENKAIIAELDKLAKERGTDRSALIREAIRQLLVKKREAVKK